MQVNQPTVHPERAGVRGTATVVAFAAVLAAAVAPVEGQPSIFGTPQQQAPSIFGGTPEPPRPSLPPPDSPTLLRNIELRFPTQGGVPGVDLNTYLYYMEVAKQVSLPSQQRWTPYTDETAEVILDDFQRLWDTGFLNDLWVEVVDDPYPNGVAAKRVIFNLDERERVKIVTYEGSEVLSTEDILDNLEQQGITLRMDSFIDPETIRRVKAVIRQGHQAQGHMFAEVDHTIEALPGGPKLVRLTFNMTEGPKVQVHEIDFIGNEAMSDRRLRGRMKKIKQRWWLSWMTGRGTYKPEEYEEDAVGIEASYRDQGYITAQVGQPELDYLELSEDGETRGLRLRIPVDEGERYRIGEVSFAGNEILLEAGLRRIFEDIEPGNYYSEGDVRKGFDDARELYGSLGYYEMTLAPELNPRSAEQEAETAAAAALAADENGNGSGYANGDGNGNGDGNDEGVRVVAARPTRISGDPVVDVTIRVQEGEQYFVNRIEFAGNQTTHDEVIRRELQVAENAVLNTEALKHSVRRLNQLGFFEPLEEEGVSIEKVESAENEVNLTFDLSETNLNQLTFGAGYSQFDGVFGQVSFQTTNFMGRGETLGVSVQRGQWANNSQLSFTRPYNFGRPISLGTQIFSREIDWFSFREKTVGGSSTFGIPLALFTRMFLTYSLENSQASISEYLGRNVDASYLAAYNPFFADALLLGSDGRRTVSKVTPQLQHNTVDHPIFPSQGKSMSLALELAGAGGNTKFVKPIMEATLYRPHTSRTIFGARVQYRHLQAGNPDQIPVFERLWLGGEYSVRGFDIRRIGPTLSDINPEVGNDTYQGLIVMGGNKSLLVNLEYQFVLGGPVRLVTFYDAGQVQDFGREFTMNDFRTSTGIELRFFMPMLNVPFRLIYYWNPQVEGIFNDRYQPQERHGFRFAMGTTF
jgi:outer membrane protein insertion porin family